MKVAGVIAEYNPFHNGHLLHITKTREYTDAVVCVISGAITQRGTPGIISKWARAEAAVKCGADLVLELPYPFSGAPAEIFAFGGVDLLNKLGIVDYISFGSESGDVEKLKKTAFVLETEGKEISRKIKENSNKSYASAVAEAVSMLDENTSLSSPNDLLGVKYIMALNKLKSEITPITFKREGDYNSLELETEYASATAIRNIIGSDISTAEKHMPEESYKILEREIKSGRISDFSKLDTYFTALLRRGNNFSDIAYVAEGVENRFIKGAEKYYTIEDILGFVKTKRYTHTRLSRITAAIMTGLTSSDLKSNIESGVMYARVLGIGKNGQSLIKSIKKQGNIPVISRGGEYSSYDEKLKLQFELEMRAGNIVSLCYDNPGPANSDMLNVPFIL